MDFRLSDEQEMFRKSVRDYVNRELPKSWARDLEKNEHAFPHELFGKLATAGFHVRNQDQEGHPAGDDRRRPEGQRHHSRPQDQHRALAGDSA